MAAPMTDNRMAMQPPGPSFSPNRAELPFHQLQQQRERPRPQQADIIHDWNSSVPPTILQTPQVQAPDRLSSYDDTDSFPEMSSSQPDEQANYSAGYSKGQFPFQNNEGEPSGSGIGPDDPPRLRSSTFGLSSTAPGQQATTAPYQPQPLFAQHSGPANAQYPSQAGPSTARPTSHTQPTPISSILHGPVSTQGGSAATTRPNTSTRSPFTTPITCPPRNRPNQLLLINPTSTAALTNLLLSTLRPILPHAVEVTVYNAPYPAPTAVESMVDGVMSSETVLRDLAKYTTNNGETVQNFDALLVASYTKHPLIDALRESYDVPVIGIMEASLYVARMLGARFGIISTSTRMKLQIDDAVKAYGLSHFYVGVESLHINPLQLLSSSFISAANSPDEGSQPPTPSIMARSKEELHKRLVIQSKALVAKGADTIILGSEFLASNTAIRVVKDAVRDEDGRRTVNVVDAVEAGVMMLNGLVGMGVPTSKKGIFRGEREGRRGRGQTWL